MPTAPHTPITRTIDDLIALVASYDPEADTRLVRDAYAFADEAHAGQTRISGEPYVMHPLATACTLADMRLPIPIVIAGILHDIPEDTARTLDDITARFGTDIASMVGGVTKLGKIKYRGMERYIENLRKMFLAMAADVRVIFIRFADRLHNLQTLDAIPQKKQYRIALESLEIYAPIANRLGMGDIKGRLEDLSFKYVYPKEYAWVVEIAQQTRENKQEYLEHIKHIMNEDLQTAGLLDVSVEGRAKHLYSLYRKLLKHDRNIGRVYDLLALRVIVDSVADCYAALGIIHSRWTPLKGRIKDYIAQPKPNGYRSLHTTVLCEDGDVVEFQIRTQEMHRENEFGIAAHWAYDEHGKPHAQPKDARPLPQWVQELADIQQEISVKKTFVRSLEDLKIDVFRDHIFVFTPKGDVIDLPEDSTCIDLAYAIHTDVGNTCVGARINQEIAPLIQKLRNGDLVEILTDKARKGPDPEWVKIVKTRQAKSKIRQFAKSRLTDWIKGLIPGGDA